MADEGAFGVVIAGGGIAALEAALALHALAGERVQIRLLAPDPELAFRPMTVGEPFSLPPASRHPVARIAAQAGAEVIADRFAHVDVERRIAHTEGGAELPYDALILALGARLRSPFAHGIVVDDRRMDELLRGIVQDVEGGYVRSVAFVSGARLGWPLPLYELALLTARRARDFDLEIEVTVVTPERAPLEVFGDQASAAVDDLLRDAGVAVMTAAQAQVPAPGRVVVAPGDRTLEADRVIVHARALRARPSAASPPRSTVSSRPAPTARSPASSASTPPATPSTSPSSRAGSPRSRRTPQPPRSRRWRE